MNKRMYTTYPAEFKLRAVERAKQGDRSVRQLESELGLSENLLRHWIQEFDKKGEHAWVRGNGLDIHTTPSPEAEAAGAVVGDGASELQALRKALDVANRRNQQLEQDNAILKKALKIFSLESK